MDKKPLFLRSLLTALVVVVFAAAMYPLAEKDYYDVFKDLLKDPKDSVALSLIEDARAREKANPDIFQSQALLAAADEKGVNRA